MAESKSPASDYPSLGRRLTFLGVYSVGLYVVSSLAAGSWKPTGGGEWLWWMSAVALYTVSTLSAPFFIRPRDSLANALVSAPMLFTVDLGGLSTLRGEVEVFRWLALCLVVFAAVLSAVAIVFQAVPKGDLSWRGRLSRLSYLLAVPLGNEVVMFTPPALISIIGFYQQRPASMLWLAAIWVLIVTVKPVQLLLQTWDVFRLAKGDKVVPELVGRVTRVDDPNIIRVSLVSPASWKADRLHTARLPGDRHVDVVPLFVQTQDDELIGTGLCCDGKSRPSITAAQVWTAPDGSTCDEVIKRLAGQDGLVDLIGFVVEESNIAVIRFEVANAIPLSEGSVVFVRDRNTTIYYQVLDAVTKEEMFTQNPRGTHVVTAGQLGTLDAARGFCKHGWVPPMNGPVFLPTGTMQVAPPTAAQPDEIVLGTIAQTSMTVKASLSEMMQYHTAVLGVTGTGKTELALDLIRAHVKAGRRVFCVDFTGEYKPRLEDCQPVSLGFDAQSATELEKLVNAIEYGQYKSEAEKKALDDWMAKARPEVEKQAAAFIEANGGGVGVFELPDIANTRATLRATELYLSAIFAWARGHRKAKEIVVVLEEAHTVIPESVMFGFDKGETQAVVARMAQIALQGRKYGVGMLLVSQRTALVSKTLLSQCNTCICFAMYDKTGLEYLESVFASAHAKAIPNLRFLQGIAFGKAIKSDRPVIFEVPEDPKKREASEALNKTLVAPPADAPSAPAALGSDSHVQGDGIA